MIDRIIAPQLSQAIADSPAVALLGPRQVGKTTLAREVGRHDRSLYLDLESEQDRARLAQLGKRLVRSPKVYVRDSGLVHALLNISDKETLLAHPVVGQRWECFVIENLLVCAAAKAQGSFTGPAAAPRSICCCPGRMVASGP